MDSTRRYDGMQHRFDIANLLLKAIGLKGIIYPGAFIPFLAPRHGVADGGQYDISQGQTLKTETSTGSTIRAEGAMGVTYFMPIYLQSSLGMLELPNATISITGKKTIVSTPLQGRRGSVKELISVNDYELTLGCVAFGEDGNYPDKMVTSIRQLYELNESVEIISAITDLIFNEDDKIVIKSLDIPAVGATEEAQAFKLTAETDASLELKID